MRLPVWWDGFVTGVAVVLLAWTLVEKGREDRRRRQTRHTTIEGLSEPISHVGRNVWPWPPDVRRDSGPVDPYDLLHYVSEHDPLVTFDVAERLLAESAYEIRMAADALAVTPPPFDQDAPRSVVYRCGLCGAGGSRYEAEGRALDPPSCSKGHGPMTRLLGSWDA